MVSKKLFFILTLIVIILVAFCIIVLMGANIRNTTSDATMSQAGLSDYSAVYMTTGDIYYGKLQWPSASAWPSLTDVWVFQRPTAPGAQYAVAPLKAAFWGPSDVISLNPAEIIFTTRLRSDSQMIAYFNDPSLISGQQVPPQPAPFQASPSPSPTPSR